MYHKESLRAATLVELLHEEELMREALSGFGWSQAESARASPEPVNAMECDGRQNWICTE